MKKVFAATIFCFFILVSQGIFNSIYALCSQTNLIDIANSPEVLQKVKTYGMLCANILIGITMTFLSKKRINQVLESEKNLDVLTKIAFVCLFFLTMSTSLYYVGKSDKILPMYYFFVCVFFLGGYYYIFMQHSIPNTTENFEEKYRALEKQMDLQVNHYNKYIEYISTLRKIKHDYLDYLNTVDYLVENYNQDELRAFIKTKKDDVFLADQTFTSYSNNPLIEAIIMDISDICEQKQIAFNSVVQIPKDSAYKNEDLCLLFTTLLTNAVAISSSADSEEKQISVSSNLRGNWLIISCSSNYDLSNQDIANNDSTAVREKLIEDIAERYHGFVEFLKDADNNLYQIQIFLPKGKA